MVAKQLGLMVYEHATQDDVLQEQLQALVAQSRKPQARTAKSNASAEEVCA